MLFFGPDAMSAMPTDISTLPARELAALFDAAPVSLWLEDFSGIHSLLDGLRAGGIRDLAAHIAAHPAFVETCLSRIRVLAVNACTLKLFGATSQAELLDNLHRVFRDDMAQHFTADLLGMWEGRFEIETEGINYALDGRPVDILIRRSVLPGHEHDWSRALISLHDIGARKEAERQRESMRDYSQGLFEHSPVSLWVEDFSGIRALLDGLTAQGVTNPAAYLRTHPDFVQQCLRAIKVLDVNERTLQMFRASSKAELLANLGTVFGGDMSVHFTDELVEMAQGRVAYECEGINTTLTGEPVDVHLQRSVMPGSEATWDRVLISLTDITARKRAEAYMRYLGTHDAMTGLLNRASYEEARVRLEKDPSVTIAVAMIDVNGLKPVNDDLGHAAGDTLIRRAAEVLKEVSQPGDIVARVGGDEFAVLMPGQDLDYAARLADRLQRLIEVNNQFYQGPELSVAIGYAQTGPDLPFAAAERAADMAMYANKGARRR